MKKRLTTISVTFFAEPLMERSVILLLNLLTSSRYSQQNMSICGGNHTQDARAQLSALLIRATSE